MDIYYDYISPTETNTNEKAINNSIKNILLTRIGSVPGKPDFGSNVLNTIFELLDGVTSDFVKRDIMNAILKWEPRISLKDITVDIMPEFNKLVVNITYEYNMLGKNIDAQVSVLIKD